jgi:hypothetical protein
VTNGASSWNDPLHYCIALLSSQYTKIRNHTDIGVIAICSSNVIFLRPNKGEILIDEYDYDGKSDSYSEEDSYFENTEIISPSGVVWPCRLTQNIITFQPGPRAIPTSEYEATQISFIIFVDQHLADSKLRSFL